MTCDFLSSQTEKYSWCLCARFGLGLSDGLVLETPKKIEYYRNGGILQFCVAVVGGAAGFGIVVNLRNRTESKHVQTVG